VASSLSSKNLCVLLGVVLEFVALCADARGVTQRVSSEGGLRRIVDPNYHHLRV